MKQTDLFSIVLVASVGTFGSFFVCQTLMGDPDDAFVKFTVVEEVVPSSLTQPNAEIFNSGAINPTVEVYVGDCEDLDHNGILDDAELEECGRIGDAEEEGENEEGGEDEKDDEKKEEKE